MQVPRDSHAWRLRNQRVRPVIKPTPTKHRDAAPLTTSVNRQRPSWLTRRRARAAEPPGLRAITEPDAPSPEKNWQRARKPLTRRQTWTDPTASLMAVIRRMHANLAELPNALAARNANEARTRSPVRPWPSTMRALS